MNKLNLIFHIFIFFFAFHSCSDSDDGNEIQIFLEAETHLNISYGSHPHQVYDLYLPAGRSSSHTKLVLLIHGGGWTGGDKNDMNGTVAILQSLHPEYAIANVNYILADADQYAFPYQFQDLRTIIEKISSESQELNIKPEFGMIGVSAGGHLAMMYDYKYDIENKVKFVTSIVGPTDFNDSFYDENFEIPIIIQLLVDPEAYPEGTDFLTELSPITHVSNSSSPTAMFFGDQDPLVPASNGSNMQEKLNQFDVNNTLKIYNGGHGDNWTYEDVMEMQSIISQYIQTYL